MTVNVFEKLSEKSAPKSSCSKSSNLSSCLMKLDYTADGSTTSSKNDNLQNKKSPYLRGDKVQMHSRITERKLVRKKTDFISSFPLAVNIYKANSDEFKILKRGNKKIKKSVLTLPNDPAPSPQICTVSDMNESEYFNENKDERKPKPRKKRTIQSDKKHRKSKNIDVYDRDAHYCSQLDIDLDSSSTDFINQFTGDGKKQTRRKVPANKTEISAHDVWAILRNLNQFQFVPSPPMSQDSIRSAKKRTNISKMRSTCRDARVIETCRTEEFAYISNFVDNSHSQSSLDRVTVIDKQDNYQEICKEFEKSIENCKSKFYRPNQKKTKSKTTRKLKANNSNNIGNNRLQVNQEQSNNNSIIEKDQRNEIVGYKMKSAQKSRQNNQDDLQFCGDFDSSQTLIVKSNMYNTQDENKLHKNKSKTQISGITKVVLSKGNNFENKRNEILRKSPDLMSPPVAAVMPKLTQQTQEVQTPVVSENQPQRLRRGKLTNQINLKARNNGEIKQNKLKQIPTNVPSIENKQNNETKPILGNNVIIEVEPEFKQKRQLKDKMLQFLYKKHPGDDANTQEFSRTKARKYVNGPIEAGTNTQINIALLKDANQSKVNLTEIEKASPLSRRTRTKGKWASDFIDSVIKKIRSGVYYNNEKHQYYDKREDWSQTDTNVENRFNPLNNSKYTRPQFFTTDEELFKTYRPHNSCKFKREIINSNQLANEILGTDVMFHNKPRFNVQTNKRSKKVNFDEIVYNTQININVSEEHNVFRQNEPAIKNLSTAKQSWSEGKWASDFIDNVFKKIKTGVYYSQDEHCLCKRFTSRIKDDWSQTDNYSSKFFYDPMNDLDLITDKNLIHDSLMLIPGFDNTFNELEIETFSQKQIAVKNCVTNVVVQFDVELPSDPCQALQLKQSFSCIPLAVTESHTTIFKSKTTIINAFLPAELCSILPMMMRRIIATNNKYSLPKLTSGKVESNLCTISELTRCETPEFAKQMSYAVSEPKTSDLLLNIKSMKLLNSIAKPRTLLELKRNVHEFIQNNKSTINPKEASMALQIYQPLNKIVQAYKPFNLYYYIENLINTKCLNLILKMPLTVHYFKIRCYNNNISISVAFENEISNINVKLMMSNVSIDSLCDNFKNSIEFGKNVTTSGNDLQNGPRDLNIHTVKSTPTVITEIRRNGSEFRLSNSKTKKKRFARLYKKCNSMSNLPNRCTISIDKITNTDEFVQALGSSKILSAVIDGNTERKILLSLKEMKNWMNDITPRQALLVLLLANKKDTPNVLRYRPVVLQGIAVNRITRASELDMEIEVIERENFNKFKQFEGISYLPSSAENQDTLLEELYWIAKTTASDYQKPFDESSERLLKSLLEKRKKLNPSYLRVMARYVGLGLLKSSK